MNRITIALLACILVCQIAIAGLMLQERAASTRVIEDLLRRREATEHAIREQYRSFQPPRVPATQTGDVQIEVLPDGSIRVDGQWMVRDQFGKFVTTKPWSGEKVIHIFSAPSTPFQLAVEIFQLVRAQGFEKIMSETR
jgi:hypothetical protein